MRRLAFLIILLALVGAGVYLFLPRTSVASADDAATLAVLNTAVDAQKGGTDFAPALDGEILANGDFVRSSKDGRAVLTFFDGSTLSVDPGSLVKVLTLNRIAGGGIQLVIEQTLGRTWASVAKLKTLDSKFEVRTPTSVAGVRGTAFETSVTRNPDGSATVTYKTDDGELLVTANAGGSVTVGANQQVTIGTNQTAPAQATPQPPTPRFVMTGSAGLGFAVVAATGATCGSAGSKQEIFGCVASGNTVTLREPPAGRYGVMLTASGAVQNGALTIEAFRGTAREASRTLTRTYAPSDLVRGGFTYAAGQPQTLSEFEPAEVVTSVCAAQAAGRLFASGQVQDRYAQLKTYAAANRGQPVAFVVTDAELTGSAKSNVPSDIPATVDDLRVVINASGVHLSAKVTASVLSVTGAADLNVGSVGGKLALRVRSLSAGPLPSPLLDQLRTSIEKGVSDFAGGFPFTVRQVALRDGCLAVMGATP